MSAVTLRTRRLSLRPPREADVGALASILAQPEVARRWPGYDVQRVRAELVEPSADLVVFAIDLAGDVIGAIQFGEETDPQYRHASIDLFIGAEWWGQGLAPEAIRAVLSHLFGALGHHRIIIDPAADNLRAIRAYEKVGFRRVGTLREYERALDGTWHDGLLMELLARDLR
jgi:aminoglycoside 6'-N-acetyltransferase